MDGLVEGIFLFFSRVLVIGKLVTEFQVGLPEIGYRFIWSTQMSEMQGGGGDGHTLPTKALYYFFKTSLSEHVVDYARLSQKVDRGE